METIGVGPTITYPFRNDLAPSIRKLWAKRPILDFDAGDSSRSAVQDLTLVKDGGDQAHFLVLT